MEDRIFGMETEYALVYRATGMPILSRLAGEKLLDRMRDLTSAALASVARYTDGAVAGEYLGNGGRLYMDRGGHPEYATPECRTIDDLLTHEKAGDRLIQTLFSHVRSNEEALVSPSDLHVFKNNVDAYGNTYGSHENYLLQPHARQHLDTILPFLVTRQIYAGAGKTGLDPRSGSLQFQISQRADFFDRTYSDRTSGVRGIINTRQREIPRPDAGWRLHLILGDSNLCETAMALKTGVTHLVLRVLEEDSWRHLPPLQSPVAALKRISRDLRAPVERQGKLGPVSALEIQSRCLEKVLHFFAGRTPSPEETWLMGLWEECLSGLGALKLGTQPVILEDDPKELYRKLDWVLKLWLLHRYGKHHDSSRRAMICRRLDFLYHDLDPASGLFEQCRSLGMVDRLTDDAAIDQAKATPPENTRARLRGAIIRAAGRKDIHVLADGWDKIILRAKRRESGIVHLFNRQWGTANNLTIALPDPFRAEDEDAAQAVGRFLDDWG